MPATPRTLSVYGGAGGRGTHISSSSSRVLYSSPRGFNPCDAVDVTTNEKACMQNLNSRLASYLTTMKLLETKNAELEEKIREWCESHTHSTSDHAHYLATIKDLKEQFNLVAKENAMVIMTVENAGLAAEDFKMKYEYELFMRKDIEADVAGLRTVLDKLTLERSDLELKYEGHKEDLVYLEKKHDEDLADVRNKAVKLNVEVDAAPSMDLHKAITGKPEDLNAAAKEYLKELEDWYKNRGKKPQKEEITNDDELQNSIKHLRELKNEYQQLEIDLQFQQKMRIVDESTLEERNAQYGSQLTNLQVHVTSLEDQLSFFRSKYAQKKQEYDTLLNIKTRLEQEMAECMRIQQLFGEKSDKPNTVTEPTDDTSAVKSSEKVDDINKSG
ncbi:keratin, type I cytoskeletal 19-like [Paramisgurnus dabryanus]|uniref:keratin, type I cytoskeletal 19-like n=1 Tax=Paramisgurnus dabryanus TaxID=90735 RepID=UPI0031F41B92